MSADVNTPAILCMENYGTLTVGGNTFRSFHWVPQLLCARVVLGGDLLSIKGLWFLAVLSFSPGSVTYYLCDLHQTT